MIEDEYSYVYTCTHVCVSACVRGNALVYRLACA